MLSPAAWPGGAGSNLKERMYTSAPIGRLTRKIVYILSLRLLPSTPGHAAGESIDFAGAVTVTGALMLAVYAIVNGNQAGWASGQTLGLLAAAVALIGLFVWIESRVRQPL